MKYDDASWHYGGDFPAGLAVEAGATHIAMFVVWAMLNGLAGSLFTETFPADLENLRKRELSPGAWFISACDGKFIDEDLSPEGNEFAKFYYNDLSAQEGTVSYVIDYSELFRGYKTLYHVPDSWETYGRIESVICGRFTAWQVCRS